MKKLYLILSVAITTFLFWSCSNDKKEETSVPIFSPLSPEQSGINFINKLTENDSINYFTYPYLYMGGGVSVGDINNDGLPDIYFTGNMVSNKLFLNKGDLKFEDITESANVGSDSRWVTGSTMADVNGDGLLDIYVSIAGKFDPKDNLLYINNGNLTFTEMAENYQVADKGNSTQSTFFDYDRDGDLDLYVANYPPTSFTTPNLVYRHKMDNVTLEESDRLYRNNSDGTFTDVTLESGLLSFGLSLSATVGDFNQDGWPDLYVSNDFQSPDYFYFNNGDGTFSEKSKEIIQHTAMYGMGADVADYNNDGLLDIYQLDMTPENNRRNKANMASMNPGLFWSGVNLGFHYQYMKNCLQLNRGFKDGGLPVFSEVAQLAGVSSTDWSWAGLFADLDNDGWKDLLVTNGTRRDINNKDFFNNIKKKKKAEIEKKSLEFSLNIPSEKVNNYAFKNNGDLTFTNIIKDWGLSFTGFSNGAAYADLDGDGDLEIIISNLDSLSVIFENKNSDYGLNNFLRFKLNGPAGNNFGLGTKITIKYNGNLQFQELTLSRGFQSSVEPIIHFGVGKAEMIDSVNIIWPDGRHEMLSDVRANQLIEIHYKDATAQAAKQKNQKKKLFSDVTAELGIDHKHWENPFDDFQFETLLPHRTSTFGPGLAVGDVNNDGLEDFFIGGASTSSGKMYLQNIDGTFEPAPSQPWEDDKIYEDMDAAIFDADNDHDLDLYVVSGGNEFKAGAAELQDRIYLNDGYGNFKRDFNSLPVMPTSGSCVRPADFDQDGDMDLFVGGRLVPRQYPLPARSYILRNESANGVVKFVDITAEAAPDLYKPGLVTAASWVDFDGDQSLDLVVAGEWMPVSFYKNDGGHFKNMTKEFGLEESTGWWFSVTPADFDQDGDVDFVAGNLGLNYKYQASEEETFDIYLADYDANGQQDIVLGYYYDGTQYPVRGRQCSSEQIPGLKYKFKDYNSFAEATLKEIYSPEGLENSLNYQAKIFASAYIENKGNGKFVLNKLPNMAQLSSINDIIIDDFNRDGHLDMVIAGNLFSSEVETPRNDASIGLFLTGDGKGNFSPVPFFESGFLAPNDVKSMELIKTQKGKVILVANNNDVLQAIKVNNTGPEKQKMLMSKR